ncbi:MAG: hypothetical protein EZS28_024888 [Streblomastix strix]|uniref:Uncharacterized protein n=1 Tax=Streblomastix strix TaxID=222440 RepID=A0A5J4VAR6_9EUKA|nr:MAG: hypothetical protein EZS28_024888 [Streblomastix strix]
MCLIFLLTDVSLAFPDDGSNQTTGATGMDLGIVNDGGRERDGDKYTFECLGENGALYDRERDKESPDNDVDYETFIFVFELIFQFEFELCDQSYGVDYDLGIVGGLGVTYQYYNVKLILLNPVPTSLSTPASEERTECVAAAIALRNKADCVGYCWNDEYGERLLIVFVYAFVFVFDEDVDGEGEGKRVDLGVIYVCYYYYYQDEDEEDYYYCYYYEDQEGDCIYEDVNGQIEEVELELFDGDLDCEFLLQMSVIVSSSVQIAYEKAKIGKWNCERRVEAVKRDYCICYLVSVCGFEPEEYDDQSEDEQNAYGGGGKGG